ncbi:P27 family phage terminase small subunit [Bradyrhizobium sp. NBAIM20]|nr:P27 family phage terminase small subunit [Bradyrhizobium sp. NBAIM20]MCA1463484.1 P27 family phage terminase small subunit [Bradyrhizobium sp. NBAIM18]
MTTLDLGPFSVYCAAYATWRQAEEALAHEGELTIATPEGHQRINPLVRISSEAMNDLLPYGAAFGDAERAAAAQRHQPAVGTKQVRWAARLKNGVDCWRAAWQASEGIAPRCRGASQSRSWCLLLQAPSLHAASAAAPAIVRPMAVVSAGLISKERAAIHQRRGVRPKWWRVGRRRHRLGPNCRRLIRLPPRLCRTQI